MVVSLLLLMMLREQRKMKKELNENLERLMKKELNEKLERLMKKMKGTKREQAKRKATKESQTTGNADDEKVKINRFHPRYSSTLITSQPPPSCATRKINNNTRRRIGIPRSTTFPQQASIAVEEEMQSEFSIPIPLET